LSIINSFKNKLSIIYNYKSNNALASNHVIIFKRKQVNFYSNHNKN